MTRSQHRVYLFSCWPREKFRLSEGNERIRPFRKGFIQKTWKQSESLVLRVVPDEEFLHTKIDNNDVYVAYGATEDIPEDACSLRQDGWRFDSAELK